MELLNLRVTEITRHSPRSPFSNTIVVPKFTLLQRANIGTCKAWAESLEERSSCVQHLLLVYRGGTHWNF